jgi:hypothetical protein
MPIYIKNSSREQCGEFSKVGICDKYFGSANFMNLHHSQINSDWHQPVSLLKTLNWQMEPRQYRSHAMPLSAMVTNNDKLHSETLLFEICALCGQFGWGKLFNLVSGVKYLNKNALQYYIRRFLWYLYSTISLICKLLLDYISKENHAHFTPYIFTDTQKYSLHFECLAGQENCPIHALVKRTSYCLWSGVLTKHMLSL